MNVGCYRLGFSEQRITRLPSTGKLLGFRPAAFQYSEAELVRRRYEQLLPRREAGARRVEFPFVRLDEAEVAQELPFGAAVL